MRPSRRLFLSQGLALGAFASARARAATTRPAGAGGQKVDVAGLLKRSGYPFEQVEERLWGLTVKGKSSLSEIRLMATWTEVHLILFTMLAEKGEFQETPAALRKLLSLNLEFDRVKIGIDEEGDLLIRLDAPLSSLDAQGVKEQVGYLAAGAEAAHAEFKPFLRAAPKGAG